MVMLLTLLLQANLSRERTACNNSSHLRTCVHPPVCLSKAFPDSYGMSWKRQANGSECHRWSQLGSHRLNRVQPRAHIRFGQLRSTMRSYGACCFRRDAWCPIVATLLPSGGLVVTVCFGFFLGLGATLAEPALSALGDSVQVLTNGRFKKKVLIGAVALGVAVGVVLGIVRIIYQLRLTYSLLPGYLVTLMLTACSSDDYAAIAWDSAGVTTGPVSAFCHLMALA